ncbi:MAG: hypothetical protein LAO04_17845, partial [Acidobacteriia bacterium]|nr:hypothetical protein [Terriglobia bacterium]
APGGTVIVSVPNVAHLWVRLSLLAGRFDYADRGILDRSHLRFFTGILPGKIVRSGAILWGTPGRSLDEFKKTHARLALLNRLAEKVKALSRQIEGRAD